VTKKTQRSPSPRVLVAGSSAGCLHEVSSSVVRSWHNGGYKRTVGEARAVLPADAGGRTPDSRAVHCDVATDRDVAASGELRTDREAGRWITGLGDVRRVPYHLDEVAQCKSLFIVEGEKDCDTIRKGFRLAATTNPMGAFKWSPEYNRYFAEKHVTIIPDNDQKGRKHALKVAEQLLPVAASVRVLELPKLPEKGDVTDWVHAGGTREQLVALRKKAQPIDDTQLGELHRHWGIAMVGQPSENGLSLVGLDELLSRPKVPKKWMWKGRLVAGAISILTSKPKVGKSTLARNLALAVARGEPFLGWPVKQGLVVYLALEELLNDINEDFRAMGADGSLPIQFAEFGTVQNVVQVLRQKKPVLLVVDPLIRLVNIKDENRYADIYSALGPSVDVARETGTHILCLHHSSKSEKTNVIDSPIGSTALGGAVSTLLYMRETKDYRTLQTVQRRGENLPETILNFDATTKSLSVGGSRTDADVQDVTSQILECLATGDLTEPQINEVVHGRTAHKRKALRGLAGQGKIMRTGTGKKGDPFVYRKA
jgi:hypothetical protein